MYAKRTALFIVSILLLAALISSLDYIEFKRILSRLSLGWIAVLILMQLTAMFFQSLRWYIIIRRYMVSFFKVLQTSLIGFMVNNLTPMSIAGGEPIRAYVISRIDKIKMEKAFATVFVDLFITLIPALLINLIAIILVIKNSLDIRIALLLAGIGLVIIALFIASIGILMRKGPSVKLLNALLDLLAKIKPMRKHVKRLESKIDELFASFHRAIKTTMTDGPTLILGFLISCLVWLLSLAKVYLIFVALGIDISFEVVFIVYAILVTVSILPLLPGALGMWEWVGTGLFTYFGVPLEAAAAIVLIDRLLFYWLPILMGLIASMNIGVNILNLVDTKR